MTRRGIAMIVAGVLLGAVATVTYRTWSEARIAGASEAECGSCTARHKDRQRLMDLRDDNE